uniref:Uncharacterized protein n=1 Tax=Ciona savignyi TaxID=51511 RepID=H2ZMY6_CIOSA
MFLCSQVHGFLLVLVAVHILGMFLPYHLRFPDQSKLHFRIVTLIQSAVVFGTLAIINFALGAALGTYIVFTTLFVQPLKGRWKFLMRSFILLSSPLVVTVIVAGFNVQGRWFSRIVQCFFIYHDKLSRVIYDQP